MNNNPKIYVLMPVYNCEAFLEDAVRSVISQPYKNIELLIIDDGSTDSSPKICDALSEKFFNVKVVHLPNQGVSAARNEGIKIILQKCCLESDYIAFCDADDIWAKNCITDDIFDPLYDILVFKSCYMSYDSKLCSEPHGITNAPEVSPGGKDVVWRYPFHFGAFLYHSSLFEKYNILFDTELKYNEDKIFLMQLLYLANSIRVIDKMLYLYRKNHSSAMYRRPKGINYYAPLIEGWCKSDEKMKHFANEQRGTLNAGKYLSLIYITDMAKEHYWYLGNKQILLNFIKNHKLYNDYISLDPKYVSESQYREHLLFINHPTRFKLKHNILGLLVNARKLFKNNKFITKATLKHSTQHPNSYI